MQLSMPAGDQGVFNGNAVYPVPPYCYLGNQGNFLPLKQKTVVIPPFYRLKTFADWRSAVDRFVHTCSSESSGSSCFPGMIVTTLISGMVIILVCKVEFLWSVHYH